ncbi:hypothetical protein G6F65_018647 [Rhizopus arrhizus]|nr:hypothetical protein G6F65_018647 [Rhizopus arrhizus]
MESSWVAARCLAARRGPYGRIAQRRPEPVDPVPASAGRPQSVGRGAADGSDATRGQQRPAAPARGLWRRAVRAYRARHAAHPARAAAGRPRQRSADDA